MTDIILPIAVNIAGWGFALTLGIAAFGLFALHHWLKQLERTESDDEEQ